MSALSAPPKAAAKSQRGGGWKRPQAIHLGPASVHAIRPSADGKECYWQAVISVGGSRITIWTGWGTPASVTRAVAAEVARLHEREPTSPTRMVRAELAVSDLLALWIRDIERTESVRPTTLRRYLQAAETLHKHLGANKLSDIDRACIVAYIERRRASGVLGRTAAGELAVLRTAWRWAEEPGSPTGAIPHRFPRIPLPASERRRLPAPRPDRAASWQIYKAVPRSNLVARRAILAGNLTGARPYEIYDLQVGDIDLVRCRIAIRDGKTGARTVEIPGEGARLLEAHVAGRDPAEMFLGPGCRATLGVRTNLALRDACARLGLPAYTLSSLRKTVSDVYYSQPGGARIEAVQLGHSPETAVSHYAWTPTADVRRMVEAIGLGLPDQSTEADDQQETYAP